MDKKDFHKDSYFMEMCPKVVWRLSIGISRLEKTDVGVSQKSRQISVLDNQHFLFFPRGIAELQLYLGIPELIMPLLFDPVTSPSPGGSTSGCMQNDVLATSQHILNIIQRYKSPLPAGSEDRSDEGAIKFLSMIYRAVKVNGPVRMVLPAFPFKSPNSEVKVLGTLPDKAEDLALAHLNGMCAAIEEMYAPGARLVIVSDGLVYNGQSPQKHSCLVLAIDKCRFTWRSRSCRLELRTRTPHTYKSAQL